MLSSFMLAVSLKRDAKSGRRSLLSYHAVRVRTLGVGCMLAAIQSGAAAIPAELARGGGIEEMTGIVRAHLEQDAHLELAKRLVIEGALQVV